MRPRKQPNVLQVLGIITMRNETIRSWRLRKIGLAVLAMTWAIAGIVTLSTVLAEEKPAKVKPAGTITIDAWTFDRGNAGVSENPGQFGDYHDKHPELILTGGDGSAGGQGEPWFVEYDIDFPVSTTFTLQVRYASAGERPMKVWLDGKYLDECCGNKTNNAPPYPDRHISHNVDLPQRTWEMHGAQWEETLRIPVSQGVGTLKFTRSGSPPNPITRAATGVAGCLSQRVKINQTRGGTRQDSASISQRLSTCR